MRTRVLAWDSPIEWHFAIQLTGRSGRCSEQSGKMISVTVHTVDGERARGASVVVSALPVDDRDGDLMFEPLGNATANESGVARVPLDLRDVKRFLASDGSIDLRVSASDRYGSDSGSYNVPVYLQGNALTTLSVAKTL